MTLNVFAFDVPLNRVPPVEVPLFVDFWPDETSEVTYVRLATKENASKKDSQFIASIPVRHPTGVVLTQENWASFLHFNISFNGKMTMASAPGLDFRGWHSISSHPSFGYYYFEIDSFNGLFAIIADRTADAPRPTRIMKTATVISAPFGNADQFSDKGRVFYNDQGFNFQKERSSNISQNQHDVYHCSFKNRLEGKQIVNIYLNGLDTLLLSPDMFHPAMDEWDLSFHAFGGFEYFQSLDGEVVFTLQKDPVQKAVCALHHLVGMLKEEEDALFVLKQMSIQTSNYTLSTNPSQSNPKILLACIDVIKHFRPFVK